MTGHMIVGIDCWALKLRGHPVALQYILRFVLRHENYKAANNASFESRKCR